MTKVHWFNPENDLALAAGISNYTPPSAAVHIHNDGAALPLWYGGDGDRVLCYGINDQWYTRMARDFDLRTDVFDHTVTPECIPCPWGWSAYARRHFSIEGFPNDRLPNDDQLDKMRSLSHRRTAAMIAKRVADMLPEMPLTATAIEIDNEETLAHMLQITPNSVLKAPWSSSGRGVVFSSTAVIRRAIKQGTDIIRRQGSVMVECRYDKALDFARIYECAGGKCRDLGTSVFSTDDHGAYTGNLLAPENERVAQVYKHFPKADFDKVVAALRDILAREIAPYYDGVVGVDMLVTADGRLDAAVEVNLRTTMGYVANTFAERHMHPEARGVFTVQPIAPGATAKADNYQVADHLLRSGTLNLTPDTLHFAFVADVHTVS